MSDEETKKRGRPSTPADQQAVPVRIERRHVEKLDEIIRAEVATVFAAGLAAAEQRGRDTLQPGETHYLERRVHLATERRRLLGRIVEWYYQLHAASTVQVVVPCWADDSIRDHEAIADWIACEELRLTTEAPHIVKVILAKNRLRRIERDDPDELVRLLDVGRSTSAEDTGDSDASG